MASFVNTPLPHFPVSIIPAYIGSFLKDFYCLLQTCFCQMSFKFLFFCLINISKFRWQKSIYFFFPSQPGLIEWINIWLFSHFFLLSQKQGLDTSEKWKFKLIFILTIFVVVVVVAVAVWNTRDSEG